MEGKLKTQHNKTSKNTNESEQLGGPETVSATREPMGIQSGTQQFIPNPSYDAMPTIDPIILPMTDIAPDFMSGPEFVPQIDLNLDESFSWEMIGLGLEEPMPTQEAVDELYDLRLPNLWYADKAKEHRYISIKYIRLYQ